MNAAEISEKNLILENEIFKLKERPQLLASENSTCIVNVPNSLLINPINKSSDSTMQDLMKQNKNLKDRNDELEYFVMNKNERGRARKRGRRTSRYKSYNHITLIDLIFFLQCIQKSQKEEPPQ